MKYWFGNKFTYQHASHVPNEPQQRQISWDAILEALNQQRTYAQLCRYVNSNAIPDLICVPNDTLSQKELNNLDLVAMYHMPNDMPPGLAPLQTGTDGNCFPRTISYLLFKTQERYTEIRVRLIYEAVKNIKYYLDDNYLSIGAHNFYTHGTLPEQYAQYSDNFNPHVTFNMTQLYKREVMDITTDGAYMGIWQIFQAANIFKRPICYVHPRIGNPNVREDLHRTAYCINGSFNNKSKLHIMWTPMQVNNDSRPCHFVPLLEVV